MKQCIQKYFTSIKLTSKLRKSYDTVFWVLLENWNHNKIKTCVFHLCPNNSYFILRNMCLTYIFVLFKHDLKYCKPQFRKIKRTHCQTALFVQGQVIQKKVWFSLICSIEINKICSYKLTRSRKNYFMWIDSFPYFYTMNWL